MVRSKGTKPKARARAGARTGSRAAGGRSRSTSASSRSKVPAAGRGKSTTTAPRRRATTSSPGISRIDQEATRTHGYFVRVGYERTAEGTWRPRHRAFFGDASHGGKMKALRAAKEWLAEVTEQD